MSIITRTVEYHHNGKTFEAFIAVDSQVSGPRPVVLVGHQWAGRDDFADNHARRLAGEGYVGVAWDVYGKGVMGTSIEENSALMTPLMENRAELLARLNAALEVGRAQPEADPQRVAAIGYCFGGLCVLDLARSGADLRGVVSFHGLLKPNGLPAQRITAKALVLHGADDPMVPMDDVVAFHKEFTAGGCDWQLHMYGHTQHAFSVPGADLPDLGIRHDADAERRSAVSARDFLREVLA
jgi:dienelactone hydrolase